VEARRGSALKLEVSIDSSARTRVSQIYQTSKLIADGKSGAGEKSRTIKGLLNPADSLTDDSFSRPGLCAILHARFSKDLSLISPIRLQILQHIILLLKLTVGSPFAFKSRGSASFATPVGLAKTRTLLATLVVENAVVHESIVEWTADRPKGIRHRFAH
jgi:hypothetical protein